MTGLKLAGGAVIAWGSALLILDVDHPAAIAILVALLGVFAVTAVIDHRRTIAAERAQIARIIDRQEASR